MDIKWIGAVLLIAGFGYIGFSYGASYKREEALLRQLSGHVTYMICELQYRQTPLPQMCEAIVKEATQPISYVFQRLSEEFTKQSAPDVHGCMCTVLSESTDIPKYTKAFLIELGKALGRFDLAGQIRELEELLERCKKKLTELEANRDHRIRSYQVFGLCAGAVLAIMLI